MNSFFKTQIFKGDTLNLNIANTIHGSKELLSILTNKYISHLIIYYTNSEGILYDTNIMAKFDINQPLIGLGSTAICWDKAMWHNSFVFKESVNNSEYYSKEDASKLLTCFRGAAKKKGV